VLQCKFNNFPHNFKATIIILYLSFISQFNNNPAVPSPAYFKTMKLAQFCQSKYHRKPQISFMNFVHFLFYSKLTFAIIYIQFCEQMWKTLTFDYTAFVMYTVHCLKYLESKMAEQKGSLMKWARILFTIMSRTTSGNFQPPIH
jgi:hypothetical protein